MAIDLKRFVDIDIQSHAVSQYNGTRGTIALFTTEGTASTTKDISSLSEALEEYPLATAPLTRAYLQIFFKNGGVKAHVIEGITLANLAKEDITALPNEYILVGVVYSATDISTGYAKVKSIASDLKALYEAGTLYGINEKILVARTDASDLTSIPNFAVKYSTVVGGEMTIAAYLSHIDVYGTDTVHDYMFTAEDFNIDNYTGETSDDTTYEVALNGNMNIDIYFANSVRNMGGNCKDGKDVVNDFVRIVLHQTLTDRLNELLATKLKGSDGIGKIYSVICDEMEYYKNCGYLSTDKVWTDATWSEVYNDEEFTIIEKGTPLLNGYQVRILPISSLTTADITARKAPPIYIALADQYGIRKIKITGEVI